MFNRIYCIPSSINEIRNSHMNPRQMTSCYLQSTTNPLNPQLEQFFQETASIYHISEPIMSEDSPKNVLSSSVSLEQFEQFHSAL